MGRVILIFRSVLIHDNRRLRWKRIFIKVNMLFYLAQYISGIMMAADPRMAGGYSPNRKLKIFNMSTQELSDLEIPDLKQINTFYPRDNAEGVFIYAKDYDMKASIYYYNMLENTVRNIFEDYEFPPEFCGIVDFTYSCN